jgi:hypothetical protein
MVLVLTMVVEPFFILAIASSVLLGYRVIEQQLGTTKSLD